MADLIPVLDRGVLYIGAGNGAGGVLARLKYEMTRVRPDATHGHGRAMHLLDGRAVGGSVTVASSIPNYSWLDGRISQRGQDILLTWLARTDLSPAAKTARLRPKPLPARLLAEVEPHLSTPDCVHSVEHEIVRVGLKNRSSNEVACQHHR